MDAVSVAASIIGIATAGIQISIKLVTLSTQINFASERVSSIGNDVSLTSGVLHQLGDLMTQKTTEDSICVFSKGGLETTRTSAGLCERIFKEIEKELGRASEQLRSCRNVSGGRIKLSKSEKLKWPSLQPSIDILRADLREAKGTLMLMLQVTTLALSKKMADLNVTATNEQGDIFRAIVALQQQQDLKNKQALHARMQLSIGSIDSSLTEVKQGSDLIRSSTPTTSALPAVSNISIPIAECRSPSPGARIKAMRHRHFLQTRPENLLDENRLLGDEDVGEVSTQTEHTRTVQSEELNLSNFTLASPKCSLDNSDTNTPHSTQMSSNFDLTRDNHPFKDYQMQLMLPKQQNKERLSLDRQNQKASDSLPTHAKSLLLEEYDLELSMFMMIPTVKDFFDKIELSWSIQTPKLHVSAIRNHLARMEAEGLPSVTDMLEILYDHEHSVINTYQHHGKLLSLKRTKTDIQHRDIVFKEVPGLQFVVEPKAKPTKLNQLRHNVRMKKSYRHTTLRGRGSQQGIAAKQHGSGLIPLSEVRLLQAKEEPYTGLSELKRSEKQDLVQDEQKSVVETSRPSNTTELSPNARRPHCQTITTSSTESLDVNLDSPEEENGYSLAFNGDLNDPNLLENFDFEQFLEDPIFSFDAEAWEHEWTTATEQHLETFSDSTMRSDMTRTQEVDQHDVREDRKPNLSNQDAAQQSTAADPKPEPFQTKFLPNDESQTMAGLGKDVTEVRAPQERGWGEVLDECVDSSITLDESNPAAEGPWKIETLRSTRFHFQFRARSSKYPLKKFRTHMALPCPACCLLLFHNTHHRLSHLPWSLAI